MVFKKPLNSTFLSLFVFIFEFYKHPAAHQLAEKNYCCFLCVFRPWFKISSEPTPRMTDQPPQSSSSEPQATEEPKGETKLTTKKKSTSGTSGVKKKTTTSGTKKTTKSPAPKSSSSTGASAFRNTSTYGNDATAVKIHKKTADKESKAPAPASKSKQPVKEDGVFRSTMVYGTDGEKPPSDY